jgi:hypothetical protein
VVVLTEADEAQIREDGRNVSAVRAALEELSRPVRWVELRRPATLGDGIRPPVRGFGDAVAEVVQAGRVSSFIPASGASTRLAASLDADALSRYPHIAAAFEELDASRLPKALLPVHAYPGGSRTALEEHLREAAELTGDVQGRVRMQFTVAESERPHFEAALARITAALPHHYEVGLSVQSPETDMPFVRDGRPVRDAEGRLRWRPGGHGALLYNLAALDGEYVLIKNIDNVVVDRERQAVVSARRDLLGTLLWVRTSLREARQNGASEVRRWFSENLGEEVVDVSAALARPIRVCGMVPNLGAPGGGPFWTRDGCQIVEGVEIRRDDPAQAAILGAATHFNPVDIAVCLRDLDGEPISLLAYAEPGRSLRASKSVDGQAFDVIEYPGLWNGGMSNWTTVFVDHPSHCFAPIKTIADLEASPHRP